MNTKSYIFFILFVVVTLTSCVKSFVPNVEKYNELLVVDGAITDGPGPYTIKLSKSSKVQELPEFNPFRGCQVMIEDNLGMKAILTERGPGLYQTDSATVQGIAGRTYKLSISTPGGENYESTPELLLKGLGIKSVYPEFEHKIVPDLYYGRDGYQFYIDTETPENADNYLLWRVQCTYKFQAEYPMYAYIDGTGFHEVIYYDTLRTCYRTINMMDLYLLNTNEQSIPEVKRMPLNYEDNYTRALMLRYSLKVTQLKISKHAYTYWSEIKKMDEAGGELYTQQPYQVKNNLNNLTHPERPVLGYFMAAGFAEKRIFAEPPQAVFHLDSCVRYKISSKLFGAIAKQPKMWPFFIASYMSAPAWVDQYCVDCRVMGVLEKPSFWIE